MGRLSVILLMTAAAAAAQQSKELHYTPRGRWSSGGPAEGRRERLGSGPALRCAKNISFLHRGVRKTDVFCTAQGPPVEPLRHSSLRWSSAAPAAPDRRYRYFQASRQRMDESPTRNEPSGNTAVRAAQTEGSRSARSSRPCTFDA